jgi:hypothetical protein
MCSRLTFWHTKRTEKEGVHRARRLNVELTLQLFFAGYFLQILSAAAARPRTNPSLGSSGGGGGGLPRVAAVLLALAGVATVIGICLFWGRSRKPNLTRAESMFQKANAHVAEKSASGADGDARPLRRTFREEEETGRRHGPKSSGRGPLQVVQSSVEPTKGPGAKPHAMGGAVRVMTGQWGKRPPTVDLIATTAISMERGSGHGVDVAHLMTIPEDTGSHAFQRSSSTGFSMDGGPSRVDAVVTDIPTSTGLASNSVRSGLPSHTALLTDPNVPPVVSAPRATPLPLTNPAPSGDGLGASLRPSHAYGTAHPPKALNGPAEMQTARKALLDQTDVPSQDDPPPPFRTSVTAECVPSSHRTVASHPQQRTSSDNDSVLDDHVYTVRDAVPLRAEVETIGALDSDLCRSPRQEQDGGFTFGMGSAPSTLGTPSGNFLLTPPTGEGVSTSSMELTLKGAVPGGGALPLWSSQRPESVAADRICFPRMPEKGSAKGGAPNLGWNSRHRGPPVAAEVPTDPSKPPFPGEGGVSKDSYCPPASPGMLLPCIVNRDTVGARGAIGNVPIEEDVIDVEDPFGHGLYDCALELTKSRAHEPGAVGRASSEMSLVLQPRAQVRLI